MFINIAVQHVLTTVIEPLHLRSLRILHTLQRFGIIRGVVGLRKGLLQQDGAFTGQIHRVLTTVEPRAIEMIECLIFEGYRLSTGSILIIPFVRLVGTLVERLSEIVEVVAHLATDGCDSMLLHQIIVFVGLLVVNTPYTTSLLVGAEFGDKAKILANAQPPVHMRS